jgi:hypothetical protein
MPIAVSDRPGSSTQAGTGVERRRLSTPDSCCVVIASAAHGRGRELRGEVDRLLPATSPPQGTCATTPRSDPRS